jgi:very-short-patch-repair endonuclease
LRHRKVAKQLSAQGIASLRLWEHQLSRDMGKCILSISRLLESQ